MIFGGYFSSAMEFAEDTGQMPADVPGTDDCEEVENDATGAFPGELQLNENGHTST
jgi:hypothetical protein